MAAIDDVLPRYDVHEVHSIALALPPEEAIARALSTPFASGLVVELLFRIRGVPRAGTIGEAVGRIGLRVLARADGEIVFGGAGTPWRPGSGLHSFESARPGQVRVVTDFRSDGKRLTTETRVSAMDDRARRSFLRYWRLVGPFSALIRRRWLKQIAG
jgi:hypothetical protein